jgi:negative modulator of initiation of replication
METMEVETDVYEHIRQKSRSGETDSQVLRRLLSVPQLSSPAISSRIGFKSSPSQVATPLAKFLESPEFLVQSDAIGKFLAILAWIFREDQQKFKAVLGISGSKRRYFASNEADLEKSGNSVMPRRIPGTTYFTVTNNDTPKKRRMIADVMRVLGYDQSAIQLAIKAVW